MLFGNTFHPLCWYINFAIAKLGTTKYTFNSFANEKKIKFPGFVNNLQ